MQRYLSMRCRAGDRTIVYVRIYNMYAYLFDWFILIIFNNNLLFIFVPITTYDGTTKQQRKNFNEKNVNQRE